MKEVPVRNNCRYAHDISDADRTNTVLQEKVRQDIMKKRSICINEFRRVDSCHKGVNCRFRHIISVDERASVELKEKMDKRWDTITGTKKGSQDVEHPLPGNFLQEFRSMMNDLTQLIERKTCP